MLTSPDLSSRLPTRAGARARSPTTARTVRRAGTGKRNTTASPPLPPTQSALCGCGLVRYAPPGCRRDGEGGRCVTEFEPAGKATDHYGGGRTARRGNLGFVWRQREFVEPVQPVCRRRPAGCDYHPATREPQATDERPPAGAKPQPTPKPPARASGVRLGCRTYCQAAGIFNGGPGESGQPAVTIVSSGAVTADGYLPVVLTCNLTVQCQGSLVLDFQRPGFPEQAYIASKSDVVVDAGATTTLEVPLDDVTLSWLQSHGSTKFQAILDAGPSFGCNGYGSDKSLGLPVWCRTNRRVRRLQHR